MATAYFAHSARRLAAIAAMLGEDRAAHHWSSVADDVTKTYAGTPVVCDALTIGGHVAEAYLLLQHTECPSWLYTVLMGGTTTWERWDSLLPDGAVNSPTMTSFNHYAPGAVADWLHRVVAGLAPAEPGYRTIDFSPRPGGTFTSAGAAHVTPYGEASIDWWLSDGSMHVSLRVPVGCTATVNLPGDDRREVGHGTHELVVPYAG